MGYVSPSLFCDHSALGEHLENTDKATTAFTTDKIAFFIEYTLLQMRHCFPKQCRIPILYQTTHILTYDKPRLRSPAPV